MTRRPGTPLTLLALAIGVVLAVGIVVLALPVATDARRRRPRPRPRPRPAPAVQYLTVRCGTDIGAARSDAVLTFDEQKFPLGNLRSVSLVKRERLTGVKANDKCCESVVTSEGAVHDKAGKRIPVAGRASLELEIGKSRKTCTLDVSTEQTNSYRCYPEVIVTCPKTSDSKVEMVLMVF